MSYAKKIGIATLYQGTSFTVSLGKDDDTVWESNESGLYEVTDKENNIVLTNPLIKSGDNLTMTFQIGMGECIDWEGEYRLISYQRDSNNTEVNVPIADYRLTYETTAAGE